VGVGELWHRRVLEFCVAGLVEDDGGVLHFFCLRGRRHGPVGMVYLFWTLALVSWRLCTKEGLVWFAVATVDSEDVNDFRKEMNVLEVYKAVSHIIAGWQSVLHDVVQLSAQVPPDCHSDLLHASTVLQRSREQ
jgi:hypothetical protein